MSDPEYHIRAGDPNANLLPPLRDIRELTFDVAVAVGKQAQTEGLTRPMSDEEVAAAVHAKMWEPRYPTYKRVDNGAVSKSPWREKL